MSLSRKALLTAGLAAGFLGATLAARSLSISRAHLAPVYDEVAYLDSARGVAARGGVLATARCYLRAECLEDNRHPLYPMLLAPLMREEPADFARAKIATLLCAALLAVAAAWGAAAWGPAAALAAAALVCLSPAAAVLSQRVLADVLLAALWVAAIVALGGAEERGSRWAAFGALAGLAFLAKGDGELLLLGGAAVAARRWGRRAFGRPEPWLALAAFAAAGSFLLARNVLVWGAPFHNVNARAIWLDDFSGFWPAAESGWRAVGPAAYWRAHALRDMALRFGVGAAVVASQLVEDCGVGPAGAKALTGALALAAAAWGLRGAWREGRKDLVLAAVVPAAVLLPALAWAGMAGVAGTRFVLPVAASLAPFAARAARGLRGWKPLAAIAAAAFASLALARRGLAADPLSLWDLDPASAEASGWIEAHVGPEGFLLPYESDFAAWRTGRDLRRLYPLLVPDGELEAFVARNKISAIVLDASAPSSFARPARLGKADRFGPTSYMGRPRCFHDPRAPSRFLAFAPSCDGARPKP